MPLRRFAPPADPLFEGRPFVIATHAFTKDFCYFENQCSVGVDFIP